jgi:hypothetical protein
MISICICTYNRSESLGLTLDSLANQDDIDSDAVEPDAHYLGGRILPDWDQAKPR